MRIILLGPTASGKTELSIQLAEVLNTSIISADSRQCYKYMDIGTAKPSLQELAQVPHFNISNLTPDTEDSAVKFLDRVSIWEQELLQKKDHIIYVGGSTLHLTGLIRPFNQIPDANSKNLEILHHRFEKEGAQTLFDQLVAIDPEYAAKMDGINKHRLFRALDVWMQTGKPFSSFHDNTPVKPDSKTIVFGLQRPRATLYNRINARVEQMLNQGLIEEVQALLDAGYTKDLQALQTVGYREILSFFEGNFDRTSMIEKIKTHTRRYAKRQLTWFRRWDFIHWLDADSRSIEEMKNEIINHL
jgi:tRNA dimethylallyltransferase